MGFSSAQQNVKNHNERKCILKEEKECLFPFYQKQSAVTKTKQTLISFFVLLFYHLVMSQAFVRTS